SSSELNTTQSTAMPGVASSSLTTVPPQPISMSSQCAPRQRIRLTDAEITGRSSGMGREPDAGSLAAGPGAEPRDRADTGLPYLPGTVACLEHLLELLLILERVHRRPESRVLVREELVRSAETPERLLDQVFALLDVVEDLGAEDEVATVDP